MGRRPAVQPPRPPNPFRNQREIRAPTPIRRPPPAPPAKRACPNKECTDPKIEDGICENCGTIVDDSNIVSEVQFGETSQGAAVVQGSYVGADQSGARGQGAGLRGAGGSNIDRERIVHEGMFIDTGVYACADSK
jgi:transcription factor IIIB subunit 2